MDSTELESNLQPAVASSFNPELVSPSSPTTVEEGASGETGRSDKDIVQEGGESDGHDCSQAREIQNARECESQMVRHWRSLAFPSSEVSGFSHLGLVVAVVVAIVLLALIYDGFVAAYIFWNPLTARVKYSLMMRVIIIVYFMVNVSKLSTCILSFCIGLYD